MIPRHEGRDLAASSQQRLLRARLSLSTHDHVGVDVAAPPGMETKQDWRIRSAWSLLSEHTIQRVIEKTVCPCS